MGNTSDCFTLVKLEISSVYSIQNLIYIIQVYYENTSHGLQNKLFVIISYDFAFRGNEEVNCLIELFKEETLTDGSLSKIIESNP